MSLGAAKPMDVFGGAWINYVEKLKEAWLGRLSPEDTIVLCGDISWGMSLSESKEDFAFLNALPGKKIMLKGNHDYWWTTVSKMNRFFEEQGFDTLHILHNNCYIYDELALCGTRGWFFEEDMKEPDQKVFRREVIRLETSLKAAEGREVVCFLHYPPRYKGYACEPILELLEKYKVKRCYYGHLHGPSHRLAMQGIWEGIDFCLISADYLNFCPEKIWD